jgi:hypothetical protein
VYLEHLTNALYLDKREDVDQYLHVMDQISAHSKPPTSTVEILSAVLQED